MNCSPPFLHIFTGLHLIVDDEMDGAPDAVVRHVGQLQGLLVDALPRQRRVAVDLDAERRPAHPRPAPRPVLALAPRHVPPPHLAHRHGVDGLEVRGVGQHGDVHTSADIQTGGEVGQHVPRAALLRGELRQPPHLAEHGHGREAQQAGEDVQPAAVCLHSKTSQFMIGGR